MLTIVLSYKCLLPYLLVKTARLLRFSSYLAASVGIILSSIITFQLVSTNNMQITSGRLSANSKQITLTSAVELTKTLAEFKKQRLPVMLFINAKWCSLCHTMENEFMNNDRVISLMENLGYIQIADGNACF